MAERRLNILVTGGAGQVGTELGLFPWPESVAIHAPDRAALDLADSGSVAGVFAERPYAAVINAAAYTAVDKAEGDAGAAFAANALGPALLADAARERDIPLVHVSTDYVFDGAADRPYGEDDPVAPLGVYGASKLAGELAVRSGQPRSVVLRTAWVLSAHRSNFLKTMLRLAETRPSFGVVDDQRGCPTAARDIAAALAAIALRMIDRADAPTGIYHFVNAGDTSWCGLARHIFDLSAQAGGPFADVNAIGTDQYPTPARRPKNSRLDTGRLARDYGITARPWQDAVAEIMRDLHLEWGIE